MAVYLRDGTVGLLMHGTVASEPASKWEGEMYSYSIYTQRDTETTVGVESSLEEVIDLVCSNPKLRQ